LVIGNVVTIPDKVLEVYDEMIQEYIKEIGHKKKKYVSARTINKLLDIVKAAVLLDGRKKATFKDLYEVKYGLCTINDNEDETAFELVFKRCVISLEEENIQKEDIKNLETSLDLSNFIGKNLTPDKYVQRIKDLKQAITKLDKIDPATPAVRLIRDDLKNKVQTIYTEGKQKFFKDQSI